MAKGTPDLSVEQASRGTPDAALSGFASSASEQLREVVKEVVAEMPEGSIAISDIPPPSGSVPDSLRKTIETVNGILDVLRGAGIIRSE